MLHVQHSTVVLVVVFMHYTRTYTTCTCIVAKAIVRKPGAAVLELILSVVVLLRSVLRRIDEKVEGVDPGNVVNRYRFRHNGLI